MEEIEKEKIREDSDDESTIDEAINKMLRLKDIEKKILILILEFLGFMKKEIKNRVNLIRLKI